VAAGQRLSLQFSDGRVGATADIGSGAAPPGGPPASLDEQPKSNKPAAKPGRRKAPVAGQGSLF